MFALHARHRELENRRKRAQFCYKKVAAKRFVKVFNRLGRKQSKLQIFPLFHTYPFKAENPPPLQLLQHPRGTSGFTSFLLQPLKGSPDPTMAQGVTDTALADMRSPSPAGPQAGWPGEDGWAVPAHQNQHLPCFSNTSWCRNLLPPLTQTLLERTEGIAGMRLFSALGGTSRALCRAWLEGVSREPKCP